VLSTAPHQQRHANAQPAASATTPYPALLARR
jgi:hypothetical protein